MAKVPLVYAHQGGALDRSTKQKPGRTTLHLYGLVTVRRKPPASCISSLGFPCALLRSFRLPHIHAHGCMSPCAVWLSVSVAPYTRTRLYVTLCGVVAVCAVYGSHQSAKKRRGAVAPPAVCVCGFTISHACGEWSAFRQCPPPCILPP